MSFARRSKHPLAFTLLMSAVAPFACAPDPGRFRVVFEFEEAPPQQGFGAFVQVRELMEGVPPSLNGGRFLAGSDPMAWSDGNINVAIDNVPHGERRFVVVRIRESTDETSSLVRYGLSEPFSLQPGDDKTVRVRIPLSPAPAITFSPLGSTETVLYVKEPLVRLVLETDSAVRAEISNFATFPPDASEVFALTRGSALDPSCTQELGSTNPCRFEVEWNLNRGFAERGLDDCGVDPSRRFSRKNQCERSVHVRFSDALDGRSSPLSQTVILDTLAPGVDEDGTSVTYVPGPNSVLSSPRAATGAQGSGRPGGTQVLVNLAFSEPLDTLAYRPTLSAVQGTGDVAPGLDFALAEALKPVASSALFSTLVSEELHPDGVYRLEVAIMDRAGNFSRVPVSEAVVVDSTPEVLSIRQDQVSFIRSPVGNAREEVLEGGGYTIPEGAAFFELGPPDGLDGAQTLPLDTFSFSSGAPVALLRVWSDPRRQNLIGTARPVDAPMGAWPRADLQLENTNAAEVYATAVDVAGNESLPVLIQNAWFVASTAPAPEGEGDHLTQLSGRARPPLAPRENPPTLPGTESPNARAVVARAERAWLRRTSPQPEARIGYSLVYDSARDRVILFGGADGEVALDPSTWSFFSDTWAWDGGSWRQLAPPGGNPERRYEASLAYDSVRGRVVLFGGMASTVLNDTWEFDGITWRSITPLTGAPAPRAGAAMVFDSGRGRTVLFGGQDTSERVFSDTWEWDGQQWREVTPQGVSPRGRSSHALAYDSIRQRVVLYGGGAREATTTIYSDTWEWDGSTWWEMPSITRPGRLTGHTMIFDRTRGQVLLAAGLLAGRTANRETWAWDGTTWSRLPSADLPAGVLGVKLVYDNVRDRVILFATADATGVRASTWAWQGRRWSDVSPLPGPSPRRSHGLIYDHQRDQAVLFGGNAVSAPVAGQALGDTWLRDRAGWWDAAPVGARPRGRYSHALAYDGARGRAVLVGGLTLLDDDLAGVFCDTWEWDGVAWEEVTPVSGCLFWRYNHALAYDEARRQTLLFGGEDHARTIRGETWVWDGVVWRDVTPSSGNPSPRTLHALAYDSTRGRLVLFGGRTASTVLNDTWEWDGVRWREMTPSSELPRARMDHTLSFDEGRSRVVLHGGGTLDGLRWFEDVWEWDGSTWRDVTPAAPGPGTRRDHVAVYDRAQNQLLIHGGLAPVELRSDAWALAPPDQPEAQLAVQLPPDLAREDLLDIRVRAFCGGRFEASGEAADGAQLLGWETAGPGRAPGAFRILATTAAGVELASSAEGRMVYRPEPPLSPAEDAKSFFGPDGRMFFQCRPDGGSGAGQAEVALDYLEVRVRYDTR